jgi:CRISPR-associated protein Csb1
MSVELNEDFLNKLADDTNGPVALHLKQKLLPVEGEGGVIFPPTYAMGERKSPYNIDTLSDGTKVATIDSVGSQANRMEPIFRLRDYAGLVPQIEIEYGDNRKVSIFEVGHRLGDALIRSTNLKDDAQNAFKTLLDSGNAQDIAKLAPTSLVFGVWDSRDTQAKLPRLVQSVIRAWGVDELTRSAQYTPAIDYKGIEGFTAEDLARDGFDHVPSTGVHGGIISDRIEQDITINLVALRRIQAGNEGETKKLRRYLLGLSLVATTAPLDGFLRQGCLLTPDPKEAAKWQIINRSGKRDDIEASDMHELAKKYAKTVADAFVVGDSKVDERAIKFSVDLAKAASAEGGGKAMRKAAKKAATKKTTSTVSDAEPTEESVAKE